MSSDADVTISVRGVSKRYEIYDRPRDRLLQMLARGGRQYFREFWALRDVSFEVRRGESVGLIGRNGSGKSTLLQLICGTLNPTAGDIEVRGRIAALLELGAGFNPEFTGRENVFMAAKLLGLSQAQVEERFDRIAAFADIGEFIEQPVKTYSSGMYVRLAFAVNAHVDADVLVIDEALAVGDAVFTQKCMRYIRSFREQGTLLFVSHDSAAVQSLCDKAVWLANGRLHMKGASREVAEAYLKYVFQQSYGNEVALEDVAAPPAAVPAPPPHSATAVNARPSLDDDRAEVADGGPQAAAVNNLQQAQGWRTGNADVVEVRLEAVDDAARKIFRGGEQVRMRIRALARRPLHNPIIGFLLRDRLGQDLFGENTLRVRPGGELAVQPGNQFEASFVFRLPLLPNGDYAVMVSVAEGDHIANVQHHWLHDALIIHVSSSDVRYGLVGIPFDEVRMEICQ